MSTSSIEMNAVISEEDEISSKSCSLDTPSLADKYSFAMKGVAGKMAAGAMKTVNAAGEINRRRTQAVKEGTAAMAKVVGQKNVPAHIDQGTRFARDAAVDMTKAVQNSNIPEYVDHGARFARTAAMAVGMDLVSGLEKLEAEIADHYLSGSKYGLAGSNGSFSANYRRHLFNNHDILSICCADKRNPYNKINRLYALWNKVTLSFFLAALFLADATNTELDKIESNQAAQDSLTSLFIFLIIAPYGYIIDSLATCWLCHGYNFCVKWSHRCGCFTLLVMSFAGLLFLAAGIAILIAVPHSTTSTRHFVWTFVESNLYDQVSPIIFGIWNWILVSWKGVFCLPTCYCYCCCCCCGMNCPPKAVSVLSSSWLVACAIHSEYVSPR